MPKLPRRRLQVLRLRVQPSPRRMPQRMHYDGSDIHLDVSRADGYRTHHRNNDVVAAIRILDAHRFQRLPRLQGPPRLLKPPSRQRLRHVLQLAYARMTNRCPHRSDTDVA